MNIPQSFRAGDTITWTETVDDYPATDGWTLAVALYAYGKTTIVIEATGSGADYLIAVDPADSDDYSAGVYSWQAYVYKEAGIPTPIVTEKYSLATGTIEILPDLSATSGTVDLRSHVKRTLDAIEALLEGKATADLQSYSIGGRALSKMSPEELIKWRSVYQMEYQREVDAQGIAVGTGIDPRKIGIRFQRL